MTTLLELAERCEKASGPDIQLDADIRDALGLPNDYGVEWRGWGFDGDGKPIEKPRAFPYTASLDAAMTLVQEGLFFMVGTLPSGVESGVSRDGITAFRSKAATPALALVAACLRARYTMEEDNG